VGANCLVTLDAAWAVGVGVASMGWSEMEGALRK